MRKTASLSIGPPIACFMEPYTLVHTVAVHHTSIDYENRSFEASIPTLCHMQLLKLERNIFTFITMREVVIPSTMKEAAI
jgi:hypothetical protein